ncbi:Bax inhibitor 1 [Marchantia polymorpha subsp. ruderalis]|uniref:Bax inhibitor 1 n=2 Tax=Marchantia polymorpha TaxID=3197 RepID=A0AAF6BCN2_MARPO|nr:hypothetical protein MARPO_0020s0020 [Marchantia polymorpha]BBN09766.1 hypothetical protein Mp_4g22500 [Marchantia polymorpha subsp. ruderalis]|eukprot:PTQ44348.1 hypothetical protein MARPO_0020s0020 [Marchantia polymorpha]
MEAASSFFESRSRGWNVNSLMNFSHLNSRVQLHLRKVYTTLCLSLLVASLGVYAHMLVNLGGFLTSMAFIGCVMWLMSVPSYEEGKRWKILMGASFLEGLSIGPLIDLCNNLFPDSGLVLTAFLGTIAIFASFSGAALFAKRREYLFLGGILSSAVSAMLTLRFCSYFFGGASAMFNLELYGGLLVFVGYVLFDTQLIIERADKGDDDYIQHTLDLFMDFVSIFVRILVILTKNAGEKSRKEESRRKRSQ